MTTEQRWITTTELRPWQVPAVEQLLPLKVGALFLDMGLGKTRAAIELCSRRQHKISRIIYVCPVSAKETVAAEIQKHTTTPSERIYSFDDKTTITRLPSAAWWYIIGLESLSSSRRITLAFNALVDEQSTVIVDESTFIRTPTTVRTERLTWIGWRARYRLILTGTPLANGLKDVYAQMRFLDPLILGYRSYYSFQRRHLVYSDRFPGMVTATKHEDELHQRIAPYVYQVKSDDVLTLPVQRYETRYIGMIPEQRALYEQAKESILLDADVETLSATAIYELYGALQHILCGFWNYRGSAYTVGHTRIRALLGILDAIPDTEKVIIWTTYHHAITEIVDALTEAYGADQIAQFHGQLNERDRNEHLRQWRTARRFLVATSASGGMALTLNEATYSVFYNNDFRYDVRVQAEKRNHRDGQTQPVTYVDIVTRNSIDERIQQSFATKESIAESFRRWVTSLQAQGFSGTALRQQIQAAL